MYVYMYVCRHGCMGVDMNDYNACSLPQVWHHSGFFQGSFNSHADTLTSESVSSRILINANMNIRTLNTWMYVDTYEKNGFTQGMYFLIVCLCRYMCSYMCERLCIGVYICMFVCTENMYTSSFN